MLNWLSGVLARFMRTNRINTQDRDSVAVFSDWSNVLMGCCDCGLMHRYDIFSDDEGQLCVRGRRDYTATLAVRRDRQFPYKDTGVGDSEQSRQVMLALLNAHIDTLEEIARECEQREADATTRGARARERQAVGVFGDEGSHITYMDVEADKYGRRAAALRALLAQPRTPVQIENFWIDIGRPGEIKAELGELFQKQVEEL